MDFVGEWGANISNSVVLSAPKIAVRKKNIENNNIKKKKTEAGHVEITCGGMI